MKARDLAGQVALVTGGGGHFGQTMCQALAGQGMRLVVGDQDLVKGRAAAATCGGLALGLDVTDPAMWANVAAASREMLGPIRFICHCANLTEEPAATPDALNHMWALQVGALELAEAICGPDLAETGGAHLLFVSAAAWQPDPLRPLWSATQAAKRYWHKARQLSPQMRGRSMLVAYDVPPRPARLSADREVAAATVWGVKRGQQDVFVPGGFGVKAFCRKSIA